jgi:8-oxo-dGTP pyrophosphatase MutT (NUDIX family)
MNKHFTATVYILDSDKVLLLYHRKLQKWLAPGGHIEENETPPQAARREVLEETGLHIDFLTQENIWIDYWNAKSFERPYLCLLEEVPTYRDQQAHQHMDFIYVARPISTHDPLEEARWFTQEELNQMKPDVDIFQETLQVIKHLFTHFGHSSNQAHLQMNVCE